jgi:hydroxymethylpyrimidine/phosphomethylpyrimidine kinase
MARTRTSKSRPVPRRTIPCVLSIAGSDSGGGAGIQADLKAFAACGVHGMTAITAITAQNTVGVTAVEAVSPEMIVAQVRAVKQDIGIDAIKIGMLGNVATIEAVARALRPLRKSIPVVLDPVMVSESGAELLEPSATAALLEQLPPRVTVLTPNLPEARALVAAARRAGGAGQTADAAPEPGDPSDGLDPGDGPDPGDHDAPGAADDSGDPGPGDSGDHDAPGAPGDPSHPGDPGDPDDDDAATLARALHALGPKFVVVTGGHREEAVDVFFDGSRLVELPGERFPSGAAHGSGCTHSSVLAARLAWGDSPLQAARTAKRRASEAVRDGLNSVGAGAGPVDVLGVT